MKIWFLLLSSLFLFTSLGLAVQAECRFCSSECVNDSEFDDSSAYNAVAGIVKPLLNKISSVLLETTSSYTQFAKAIETPPKIV